MEVEKNSGLQTIQKDAVLRLKKAPFLILMIFSVDCLHHDGSMFMILQQHV